MYWIYLAIFILAVLTPKFIQQEWWFLGQEDIESLLIFCFGALGFMIYLAKEKTLLRLFREKLHLQKQANIITRDLSDSYSYIGEMNRKLDIVNDLIFDLPGITARSLKEGSRDIYAPLLKTASLLTKTDQVMLCFVDTRKKSFSLALDKSVNQGFLSRFSAPALLGQKKFFWEEQNAVIVRSPKQARGISAFLIFEKTRNHVEDGEVFKIIVSEALLLYCFDQEYQQGEAGRSTGSV